MAVAYVPAIAPASAGGETVERKASAPTAESRILVVPVGETFPDLHDSVAAQAGVEFRRLDRDGAVSLLRRDPFAITALILSGEGGSPVARATLETIKSVAPRLPIVFLDETESEQSELSVRRLGVHYYSHLPANPGEIAAVVGALVDNSAGRTWARVDERQGGAGR